jgi:hypothetical protein
VRLVPSLDAWETFRPLLFQGMVFKCTCASQWTVRPSFSLPQSYQSIRDFSTQLRQTLGEDVWNTAASTLLSGHLVALMQFDELREDFECVESRHFAARTPLHLVCSCGVVVTPSVVNCRDGYLEHLKSCRVNIWNRWTLRTQNPFASAAQLDAVGALDATTDSSARRDQFTLTRDIPIGITITGYWSSLMHRLGLLSDLHVGQQHARAQTVQAVRAACRAPPGMRWDDYPVLKSFSRYLFAESPSKSYNLLHGQGAAFAGTSRQSGMGPGMSSTNFTIPAMTTQQEWNRDLVPVYSSGPLLPEITVAHDIMAACPDVPRLTGPGREQILLVVIRDGLMLDMGSFPDPHFCPPGDMSLRGGVNGTVPVLFGNDLAVVAGDANPQQAYARWMATNNAKYVNKVTEFVVPFVFIAHRAETVCKRLMCLVGDRPCRSLVACILVSAHSTSTSNPLRLLSSQRRPKLKELSKRATDAG